MNFNSYPKKEILKNAAAIGFGVVTALAVLYFLFIILLIAGQSSFGGTNKTTVDILGIIAAAIPAFLAGLATAALSTRDHLVHAGITAIILLLLLLETHDFRLDNIRSMGDIVTVLMLVPLVVIGGYFGRKLKIKDEPPPFKL